VNCKCCFPLAAGWLLVDLIVRYVFSGYRPGRCILFEKHHKTTIIEN
jgi:hypothetical protein